MNPNLGYSYHTTHKGRKTQWLLSCSKIMNVCFVLYTSCLLQFFYTKHCITFKNRKKFQKIIFKNCLSQLDSSTLHQSKSTSSKGKGEVNKELIH